MNNISFADFFEAIDEPYASGLFSAPEKGYFYRHCMAYAKWFTMAQPPAYQSGERLYPRGTRYFDVNYRSRTVRPVYAPTYEFYGLPALKEKCLQKDALEAYEAMEAFTEISRNPIGWTHGAPNYARIVKEGLDSYRERVLAIVPDTTEKEEFRDGLLALLDAMKGYTERCVAYLASVQADEKLIDALKNVPFKPARTYYEGLVCWNAIFYFDGCDNLGCLDLGLAPLYRGEDLTDVIGELFDNVDAVGMWSCTIGPAYNEITRQALRASKGRRRPLLELRVTDDMPDDLWALASESILSGCGSPSFYNEKGIHDMLHERFPQIPESDLKRVCFCGCTETNIEGLTHAGGTDLTVNLLQNFEEYLYASLAQKKTFADFFEGACQKAEAFTEETIDATEEIYRYRAQYLPHPMRTLLWDDCIDKAKDFNNGGTRYSWTMNTEAGLINVIDCLAAIKDLYYDKQLYSAEDFLSLLKAEDPMLFTRLRTCPCFGVDDAKTDAMGAAFAERVFSVYRRKKPTLAFLDGFTLTEHQYMRHEPCGMAVGPTPDGRRAGQATCDSLASLRGKAVKGPTAMLCSAARLPQNLVDGISVVNLTLAKDSCGDVGLLRSLISGYFHLGGIQVQLTVTSVEELQDALAHPERHEDLIVRVGGYSDYFNRLSPALKQAVVERNVHELG